MANLICQPNELKQEIKKKTGGAKGGAKQKSGGHGPTTPPLRIATGSHPSFQKNKEITKQFDFVVAPFVKIRLAINGLPDKATDNNPL